MKKGKLRHKANSDPRGKNDPRWNRDCNYCWLYLRKHYSYDYAHKHQFCPTCKANLEKSRKEEKQVDGDLKPEVKPAGIKRPKPREAGKLSYVVVSGRVPRPLENVKWSTLKEWAEHLRDRHERKGQFLTVGGLVNLAYRATPSYDKGSKAAQRLKDLYRKEWEQWREGVKNEIESALRREREAEEKRRRLLDEKQKAHQPNQLTDAEQQVLDVLSRFAMNRAEIRKASKLKKVSRQLRVLVSLGLAIKANGKYKLARKEKLKNKVENRRGRR